MTLTYSVAACLYTALLVFILPSMSLYPGKRTYRNAETSYGMCFQIFVQAPLKLKLLLFAHFFSYGAYILIAVYATSWVGISVLDGTPNAEKYTLRRRVFETGVSWGAFAMLLSSLVSMFSSLVLPHLRRHHYVSDGFLWGLSQAIAAIALLTTSYITEFRGVFVILPLCGFAFSTVTIMANDLLQKVIPVYTVSCPMMEVPHRAEACPSLPFKQKTALLPALLRVLKNIPDESEKLHLPATREDPWSEMMASTSLLAQIFMFSLIPSTFLLWPEGDDNKWGMVTAGFSSLLGSICAFLI